MNEQEEILIALSKDFELSIPAKVSRETILEELEIRISQLLHQNAESFFQLLYRLDISENKITATIERNENTVAELALLIYERQLQKLISRRENKSPSPEDEELSW